MFNSFIHPWVLCFFVPLVVAMLWAYRCVRRKGIVFAEASARFTIKRWSWRMWATRILPGLFFLGLAMLILAAAGPAFKSEEVEMFESHAVIDKDALAIFLVADVSGSMEALDFAPKTYDKTRLDVVKQTFVDFIGRSSRDDIGLVTFGGYPRVLSPLTSTHEMLKAMVASIKIPGIEGEPSVLEDEQMTALGDGLAVAVDRIKNAIHKNKIIILLSDGVNNAGIVQPLDAARLAKEEGVKVYTIGIGSTGQVPIRMYDPFRGGWNVQRGYGELDEQTLREIAQITGANYTNVRSATALEKTFKEIEALERTKIQAGEVIHYTPPPTPWSCISLMIGIGVACIFVSSLTLVLLLRRPI